VIGVQVFGKGKIYKPTWTQNHPESRSPDVAEATPRNHNKFSGEYFKNFNFFCKKKRKDLVVFFFA
jgi:hypothetical protein